MVPADKLRVTRTWLNFTLNEGEKHSGKCVEVKSGANVPAAFPTTQNGVGPLRELDQVQFLAGKKRAAPLTAPLWWAMQRAIAQGPI
jgi:hypothetical protein